jgi:hypothetical protein
MKSSNSMLCMPGECKRLRQWLKGKDTCSILARNFPDCRCFSEKKRLLEKMFING